MVGVLLNLLVLKGLGFGSWVVLVVCVFDGWDEEGRMDVIVGCNIGCGIR